MSVRSSSILAQGLRVAVLLAMASALPACSSWNPFGEETKDEVVVPDEPADSLYNQGLSLMEGGSYGEAAKKFAEVDRQHPYTDWARKSVLMTAYANYKSGNYDECISNSKRYLALHPGSPDAAYAQYLMAMSYYNDIPDISRDQTRTERALLALNEVVTKYPDSEYAASAKKQMMVANDQLAGKEMDIGRYYLKQRNFAGAINRFRVVITRYQTTRHVEEALMRVAEAYMGLGITTEAQTAAVVLGHNFPDSPWYKDAYTLVSSNGETPREDTGSWISKAFKKVGLG